MRSILLLLLFSMHLVYYIWHTRYMFLILLILAANIHLFSDTQTHKTKIHICGILSRSKNVFYYTLKMLITVWFPVLAKIQYKIWNVAFVWINVLLFLFEKVAVSELFLVWHWQLQSSHPAVWFVWVCLLHTEVETSVWLYPNWVTVSQGVSLLHSKTCDHIKAANKKTPSHLELLFHKQVTRCLIKLYDLYSIKKLYIYLKEIIYTFIHFTQKLNEWLNNEIIKMYNINIYY